ncbi:unnamed protein product [Prorocentrum cordatum]|uniref:Uncharacterized protein n=1 Tax=Prorocentrum cordatum TaxID=2364126 RepID=A0ABN9TSB1_9DINO|nr:unnamed protein product [Polarella glacialis]
MIGKGRAGACSFPESFLPRDPRQRLSKGARARRGGRREGGILRRRRRRRRRRRKGRIGPSEKPSVRGHAHKAPMICHRTTRAGRAREPAAGAAGSARSAAPAAAGGTRTRVAPLAGQGRWPRVRGLPPVACEVRWRRKRRRRRRSRGWREEHAVGCAGLKGQGPQAGRALRARSSATVDSAAPTATRGSVGQKAAMMSRSSARASSLLTEGSSGGALQVTDTFRSRNTAGNSLCLALKPGALLLASWSRPA